MEAGDRKKPLVLLLHGFPDCWLSWREQIQCLAEHYRFFFIIYTKNVEIPIGCFNAPIFVTRAALLQSSGYRFKRIRRQRQTAQQAVLQSRDSDRRVEGIYLGPRRKNVQHNRPRFGRALRLVHGRSARRSYLQVRRYFEPASQPLLE